MPRWFYKFCVAAVAVALLLPYKPVKYTLVAVFGAIFLSFYRTAPERTLFVFVLGMPVLDLLPPLPIPGLNTETFLIVGLAIAARIKIRQASGPIGPNPFTWPVAYYAVLLTVSGAITYATGKALDYSELHGWVPIAPMQLFSVIKNLVFVLFLAPITYRLIVAPEMVRTLLRLMAVTCTLVSIHALWETRRVVLAGFMLERNRASGLVAGQPNLFGGFLAIVIVIFLSAALSKSSSRGERLLYAVTIVFCSAALLMTLSRGSWLALVLTGGVLALVKGVRMIAVVLVVALSAPLWLPQKVVERFNHTFEGHYSSEEQELEDSAQVRVDQWKSFPDMFSEAPVFGHGFMVFPQVWERYSPDHEPKSAHSTVVNLGVEAGALGLVAYYWLLGTLALGGYRLWRRSPDPWERDLALGYIASLFCLFVLDGSGTRFHNREVMAYVWVLGGALHSLAALRGRTTADSAALAPATRSRRFGRNEVGRQPR